MLRSATAYSDKITLFHTFCALSTAKGIKLIMRIIVFILMFILTSAMLAACAETVNQNAETSAGISTETEPETEDPRYIANLPEADYEGYTFTFIDQDYGSSYWQTRDLVSEAANGDLINDAVYARNQKIAEEYNVTFKEVISTDYLGKVTTSIKAGDDVYDCIQLVLQSSKNMVLQGYLLDANLLPYLDLDKAYWDSNVIDAMTIAGKTYMYNGDINISHYDSCGVLLFNKNMQEAYGTEDIYDIVNSGAWTMDKLIGISEGITTDLNGDNQLTLFDDAWGYIYQLDSITSHLIGGGGNFALKDENKLPYDDFYNDLNVTVSEKIADILSSDRMINCQIQKSPDGSDILNFASATFEEERGLFFWVRLRQTEIYRSMNTDFGIIPIPKYSESQDDYRTEVNIYIGTMLTVPITCTDPERTSVILEALAESSSKNLKQAYYDTNLTVKLSRDTESEKMLDIILNNVIIDIGEVYQIGGLSQAYINLYNDADNYRNLASFYAEYESKITADIEKLIAAFSG